MLYIYIYIYIIHYGFVRQTDDWVPNGSVAARVFDTNLWDNESSQSHRIDPSGIARSHASRANAAAAAAAPTRAVLS